MNSVSVLPKIIMTLTRSADAWCSCEFSSGILAQVSLDLLIWSQSEGQSFTYQNLFLPSLLCKSCLKFRIPEMETPSANTNGQLQLTLMFSFYINRVSKVVWWHTWVRGETRSVAISPLQMHLQSPGGALQWLNHLHAAAWMSTVVTPYFFNILAVLGSCSRSSSVPCVHSDRLYWEPGWKGVEGGITSRGCAPGGQGEGQGRR